MVARAIYAPPRRWLVMGLIIGAIIASTVGCASGIKLVDTQRCPTIKPVQLQCKPFDYDREEFTADPHPVERLQVLYLKSLGLLSDARTINAECRARDEVWGETWDSCGNID